MIFDNILTKTATSAEWDIVISYFLNNIGTIIILLILAILLILSLFAYTYYNESVILLISTAITLLSGYHLYSNFNKILSLIADFNRFFEITFTMPEIGISNFNFVYEDDYTVGELISNNLSQSLLLVVILIIIFALILKLISPFFEEKRGVRQ